MNYAQEGACITHSLVSGHQRKIINALEQIQSSVSTNILCEAISNSGQTHPFLTKEQSVTETGVILFPGFRYYESCSYYNFMRVLAYRWGLPYGCFRFTCGYDNNGVRIRFYGESYRDKAQLDSTLGQAYVTAFGLADANDPSFQEVQSKQRALYNDFLLNFQHWIDSTDIQGLLNSKPRIQKNINDHGYLELMLSPSLTQMLTENTFQQQNTVYIDAEHLLLAHCIEHLGLWPLGVSVCHPGGCGFARVCISYS